MFMEEIRFLYDCLLINNILVIGDLHIGYNTNFYEKNIKNKLDKIFNYINKNNIKIDKIILLGDIKHNFDKINDVEWREIISFFQYIKKIVSKIVVIKGNHDVILEPIIKKINIKLKNYYKININNKKYCFLHGDKIFKECFDADFLILGHLHPAIIINDNYKYEKYKCFLKGKLNKKDIIILPSFNDIKYGYNLNDINKKDDIFFISNKKLKEFEVIIYNDDEEKDYNFGKLKNLI
jgi:putative SbcD/Mre11-related phosphoesterase